MAIDRAGAGLVATLAAFLAMALALPARAAEDVELRSAFAAAFGGPGAVVWSVERPEQPPGSGARTTRETVQMQVEPEALIRLEGERYALIASEIEPPPRPSRADPGAIAVAYLQRSGSGWTLEKVWREVTWAGSNGRPTDAIGVLGFRRTTLILATRTMGGQGQSATFAWIISLTADGPKPLGNVPVDGALAADSCPGCRHYAYEGRIGPPTREGAALSVAYGGWTVAPGRGKPRVPFVAFADYDAAGGALKPEGALRLPDGTSKAEPGGGALPEVAKRAARLAPDTPQAFADQLVALYGFDGGPEPNVGGRLWDQWHDSLYDPELLQLMGDNRQLEVRPGNLFLDHDPICGCQSGTGSTRIHSVALRPDGLAEVKSAHCGPPAPKGGSPQETCSDVDLLIKRFGDGWKLYDVLEPGSLRNSLISENDRLRGETIPAMVRVKIMENPNH
jgi:hypothetical protein